MASNGPEGSNNPSFGRGSNQSGRRHRPNRGRGNGRNGFPDGPSESWNGPQYHEADTSSLNGAAARPKPSSRGRGRGSGQRSSQTQRNRSDNHPADADIPHQSTYYRRDQEYDGRAQQRQQQPVGQHQQINWGTAHPHSMGHMEPGYGNQAAANPYASFPPQDLGNYYGPANSHLEYYQPTAAASGPSRPKQSRGPKSGDQRRGGYDQRHNGHSAAAHLEHQPFENIGREYFNSRPVAPRAHHPQQQSGRGATGGSQDVRYRREDSGRYSPQDVRYRSQESVGGAAAAGYRREEVVPLPPPQKPPGKSGRGGRAYESQNWRSDGYKKNAKIAEAIMADTATQRERLTTQLTNGTYECMVCCESVKPVQVFY